MKNTLLFLSLLILLSPACDKKDEPIFIDQPSVFMKYVVYLSGSEITRYSKYNNDKLLENTSFFDFDTIVEVITRNEWNDVVQKTSYRMGTDGFAMSSFDTVYRYITDDSLNVDTLIEMEFRRSDYQYASGFLIEKETVTIQNDHSSITRFVRTIENENTRTLTEELQSECTVEYTYYNELNRMDLSLTNEMTGRRNKNLLKHIAWISDCACGSSKSFPFIDFQYEFDENGYVIKKTEIYTPCYPLVDPGEVFRTTYITEYVYNETFVKP